MLGWGPASGQANTGHWALGTGHWATNRTRHDEASPAQEATAHGPRSTILTRRRRVRPLRIERPSTVDKPRATEDGGQAAGDEKGNRRKREDLAGMSHMSQRCRVPQYPRPAESSLWTGELWTPLRLFAGRRRGGEENAPGDARGPKRALQYTHNTVYIHA